MDADPQLQLHFAPHEGRPQPSAELTSSSRFNAFPLHPEFTTRPKIAAGMQCSVWFVVGSGHYSPLCYKAKEGK
jgi:hypothetical protein